ncbi:MAG: hypothetical protein ACE37K_08880 [Planctomycetota bacterium]
MRAVTLLLSQLSLVLAIDLRAQQSPVVPVVPVGTRYVHPAVAPPAPGAIRNGTSPLFQYPDGEWNHGEGLIGAAIDSGGWFGHDDGTGVTSGDVHTPFFWEDFHWKLGTHPLGGGTGHLMKRLYGYLRPSAIATRPDQHPLYGDLGSAAVVGPFGDRTYVDQAAFEIFRPNYLPTAGQKVVLVIGSWETILFPQNKDGDVFSWRHVYPGFFSPDGLIRNESTQPRSPTEFFNNNDIDDVKRPRPIVIARAQPSQGYYPLFAYIVPSVMHREAELNQQRDLQLVQAVKAILMEDPSGLRNPMPAAMDPATVESDLYVVFAGSSNGGLGAMWASMRHPEIVHGNLSAAIHPSVQRMIGELDMKSAVARLSGRGEGGTEASERDILHWGRYAWHQGYWIHDVSALQRYMRGQLHRPCLFAIGDEDITSTGTDWIRTVTGGAWSQAGVQPGLSALGSSSANTFAWTAAERGCHGDVKYVNPYDQSTEYFWEEMLLDLIPQVIAQKDALGTTAIPPVASQARTPSQEAGGPDDPHEWALGRIGVPMSTAAGLQCDHDWFHATQHGAAGTMLGYKESMLIRDGALFAGSAEGVVTRFVVDPTSKALVKQAHSNPGDASATLPFGTPMALGHEAFALTAIEESSGWSLVVATRRHLHKLDPSDLTVMASVPLPYEISRPRHLKVGNVLPDTFHAGDEIVYCSQLGGLVCCDASLNPIWEWPEAGILDFHIGHMEAAILSQRGVVARVEFVDSAGGPKAQLLASSKPMPLPGDYESSFTQGDPVDLERMQLDLSFATGLSSTSEYVAAWNGDGDGGAVRVYAGPGLTLAPMIGMQGRISDIATTNQPVGYLGTAQDMDGDHLLLLSGTELRLFDQTGAQQGAVTLNLRQSPGGVGEEFYTFGDHAMGLAVGELYDPGVAYDYADEVVIGTHSGSLVWLHVEEVKGASHPLPSPEFDLVVGSGMQPRTNQQLSATWAVSERAVGTDLHCLDRRGAYWTLSDTGLEYQDGGAFAKDAVGWQDADNRNGATPVPFLSDPLISHWGASDFGVLNRVRMDTWSPKDSAAIFYEASGTYLGDNWEADRVWSTLYHGFVLHRRPADQVWLTGDRFQFWAWSGRGTAAGNGSDWGNTLKCLEFNRASDRVEGMWSSVGIWPGGLASCPHLDLRSFTTQLAIMNEQSVRSVVLSDGSVAVFLGCPGGRVRCLRQHALRRDDSTPHQLGATTSSQDLGFAGGALAVDVDANDVVTIWFGTGAAPAARALNTSATALLDEPAKVTGAVHRMTWTAASGFSSANSFVLAPNTVGATRGGYGVVGLQLANVLGSSTSPSEVIVGTISGEILALDTALGSVLWRATVPGAAGCFNAIHVADVDGDGMDELYVCGSFGIWRFKP